MLSTNPDLPSNLLFEKLLRFAEYLLAIVRGQPVAALFLIEAVQGFELRSRDQRAFLLAGPTGVGKNTLIEHITSYLGIRLLRLNMSEFKTQESWDRLLGNAKTGYRGQLALELEESEGRLWLLFDEIEKGNPEFSDLLLQALDDSCGIITTQLGEALDLRRSYIALTTNLGTKEVLELRHSSPEVIHDHISQALKAYFRPELLGRFREGVVLLNPLDAQAQREICVDKLEAKLKAQRELGRHITYQEELIWFLLREAKATTQGGRGIHGAIDKWVGNAITRAILKTRNQTVSGELVVEKSETVVLQ